MVVKLEKLLNFPKQQLTIGGGSKNMKTVRTGVTMW